MKRNYSDWLSAYLEYTKDSYGAPKEFNAWTGLSVLSAALERNVWVEDDNNLTYPTTFILLVGHPGVGKSSAIRRGAKIIEYFKDVYDRDKKFKTMTGAATQAGFITTLSVSSINMTGDQSSSLYYYAGEGSDSGLNNLHGDFTATLTLMYDCEDKYEKTLKEQYIYIPKPSVCFLAGCTFEFLKGLINQNSVMNGLASRFIYAVSNDDGTRKGEVNLGVRTVQEESSMIPKLAEDIAIINTLRGPFKVEKSANDLLRDWFKDHNKKHKEIESERMKSIMVRKPVNLYKLLMLLSVSERNDLGITLQHMDRGIQMIEEVTKDNTQIIASSLLANKMDQRAINQFILQAAKEAGGAITAGALKNKFLNWGGDISKFETTAKMMAEAGQISIEAEGARLKYTLLIDPNKNL